MAKSISLDQVIEQECKSISLDHVIEQECNSFRAFPPEIVCFLFDACALKLTYDPCYEDKAYTCFITYGVIGQVLRHEDIFGKNAVKDIMRLLHPRILMPCISQEDEEDILQASLSGPKRRNFRNWRDKMIGEVDSQQIGYALALARKHRPSVLLSDDSDILSTVRTLRQQFEYAKTYISAVSLRRYLEKKYSSQLAGLTQKPRDLLFQEIYSRYQRVVA